MMKTAEQGKTATGGTPAHDARVEDIVQAGEIRAAFFLPQFSRDAATGELVGHGSGFIGIAVTHAIAQRLGVEAKIVGYPTPAEAVERLKTGAADIAFLGIEPSRAEVLEFSPAVFQFEYTYVVSDSAKIRLAAEADRPGIRIVAVRGHASTLTLTRITKHAILSYADLPDEAFALLRTGQVDALALTRQDVTSYSRQLPGSRVLEGFYGINRVGIALQKGRPDLLAWLGEFVDDAKASGLIQGIIDSGNMPEFQVAT